MTVARPLSAAHHTGRASRRPLARTIGILAGVTAALLALGGAAASAAETVYLDHSSTSSGFSGNWGPSRGYEIAQPFEPRSTGVAVELTLETHNGPDRPFSGAAIHAFPLGGDIAPEPIAGGAGVIAIAAGPQPGGFLATVSFPGRPLLTEGTRYALVIDPAVADGGTPASFPMSFLEFNDPQAHLFGMTREHGSWEVHATGRLFTSLWMATAPAQLQSVTPQAPRVDPAAQCGVAGTVTLPEQEGVSFARVDSAGSVTVTAVAEEGFVFPEDAVASWTIPLPVLDCPVVVTPSAPTIVAATCQAPRTVSLPEQRGVTFAIGAHEGAAAVLATADEGYVLSEGAVATWPLGSERLDCGAPGDGTTTGAGSPKSESPRLAATGAEGSLAAPGAAALALLGGALLLARAGRRARA